MSGQGADVAEHADAVVFPGQGSQRQGMGADFHRQFEVARRTFEEASDAVQEDLAAICFGGDRRLHLTEFTQPCVLTMEIAAYRVAAEVAGVRAGYFGGHSLGEITALVAADVIPFGDAVSMVRGRGALMQRAVPRGHGAMAALMLDDIAQSEAADLALAAGAEVANINSPSQLVISGTTEAVERARSALEAALPRLSFVGLAVSAPFHSSLMEPVRPEFEALIRQSLHRWRLDRAAVVTSNLTGGFHDPRKLVANLVDQICSPVRWLDNMRALMEHADRIIEIGPRAALGKLFRAEGRTIISVTHVAGIAACRPRSTGAGPPVDPRWLGDPGFLRDHHARLAYAAGGTGSCVPTPRMVVRLAREGLLGFLGTSSRDLDRMERDVSAVSSAVGPGAPWGVGVRHDRYEPAGTARLIDAARRLGVPCLEVAGFTSVTPELVRYRVAGLAAGEDGVPVPARRVLARLSHPDTCELFFAPPPVAVVSALLAGGALTEKEARQAQHVPMADDVGIDADIRGNAAPLEGCALMPVFLRMRDNAMEQHRYEVPVRVGACGGLGSPEAVAAAFTAGAGFVMIEAVNQCSPEAETSAAVKDMLASCDVYDFALAPSDESFELGGQVQVLRKGSMYAARSRRLHELYLRHGSVDEIEAAERERIEAQYFLRSIDEVWAEILADATRWGTDQVERARHDARARMVLLFRWYLADSLRRAQDGDETRRLNYQIRGDPSIGAFNRAVRGTPLEDWRARHVDEIAWFLLQGAASVIEEHMRRVLGIGCLG